MATGFWDGVGAAMVGGLIGSLGSLGLALLVIRATRWQDELQASRAVSQQTGERLRIEVLQPIFEALELPAVDPLRWLHELEHDTGRWQTTAFGLTPLLGDESLQRDVETVVHDACVHLPAAFRLARARDSGARDGYGEVVLDKEPFEALRLAARDRCGKLLVDFGRRRVWQPQPPWWVRLGRWARARMRRAPSED